MPKPAAGIYLETRDVVPLVEALDDSTYDQLRAKIGCSKGYLHQLAHGAVPRVTVEMAARVEDALDRPRGSMFALSAADSLKLAPYGAEMCRLAS